jgi:hypothetical protein
MQFDIIYVRHSFYVIRMPVINIFTSSETLCADGKTVCECSLKTDTYWQKLIDAKLVPVSGTFCSSREPFVSWDNTPSEQASKQATNQP